MRWFNGRFSAPQMSQVVFRPPKERRNKTASQSGHEDSIPPQDGLSEQDRILLTLDLMDAIQENVGCGSFIGSPVSSPFFGKFPCEAEHNANSAILETDLQGVA